MVTAQDKKNDGANNEGQRIKRIRYEQQVQRHTVVAEGLEPARAVHGERIRGEVKKEPAAD